MNAVAIKGRNSQQSV